MGFDDQHNYHHHPLSCKIPFLFEIVSHEYGSGAVLIRVMYVQNSTEMATNMELKTVFSFLARLFKSLKQLFEAKISSKRDTMVRILFFNREERNFSIRKNLTQ